MHENKINGIAVQYLMFPSRTPQIYLVIPIFAGFISFVLSEKSVLADGERWDIVHKNQEIQIEQFIGGFTISISLIMAFLLCYRWSIIQRDGSYAYWLTQGVERKRFLFRSFIIIIGYLSLSLSVGIYLLYFPGGVSLPPSAYIQLLVLSIIYIALLTSFSFFISEVIRNPELSALTFMISVWLNLVFNNSPDNLLHKILQPAYHFLDQDIFISLGGGIAISGLLYFITLLIHVNRDIHL
ncbi:MAG: hypothetical protein IH840_03680 [Candidatus Heimdallarchaeota archaeon]|nr:hypothetical protein [Candidatus Heimdallarchaeota archaeon]